ncbi:asparagine synthase-related protein [uncultured Desulfovibrio sp.]|uniref:asparagine synthetase B family protein n=1 Tax=uncultured Desulfovibrio sp. TaxID=167968 RepID=UPI002625CA8D|nr:asparagine synthase-related protein [uncultured Desulfovibrio sp.]
MTGLCGTINTEGYTCLEAQKMCTDNRFILALHGRIGNIFSLCADLPDTHSITNDAVALLCLWRQKGSACLSDLDGPFALAVWDAHERTITLARDRFGLKPLYYTWQNRNFAFSSDAIAIAPRFRHANLNAIFQYLTVQSVPAPLCAFNGVSKLPHAVSLTWRMGAEPHVRQYWTPVFTNDFSGTLDDAATELHSLLTASMKRQQLVHKTGMLLSGGVDSSLMAALFCEQGRTPATFALGFDDPGLDERPFAREVADLFRTEHHEILFPPPSASFIETLVTRFGEPFADSSALPTWLALRAAHEANCTTAVLGDGGDDLFAGYKRHLSPFLCAGSGTEDVRTAQLRTELDGLAGHISLAAGINAASARFYTHWARFWGPLKRDVCGEALCMAANPPASILLARHIFRQTSAQNLLNVIQLFELDYYLPCTLTAKVEVPARACGIATVAPFLCNEIAKFTLSLPAEYRVGACGGAGSFGCGFETKRAVKRLAERYLPRSIVYRRKMGFGVPLAQWLRGPLRELLHDTLLSRRCAERGWLVPATVRRLLDEHAQVRRDWHHALWTLLMLELWAKTFLDTPPARQCRHNILYHRAIQRACAIDIKGDPV